ncbi:MAG TPA: ankyrin repeat domain-containing protein [Gammaproteobacteria bacterium]|nr:ankyrin repeat domain-containing protein [Gammaproteobacteria bacterium]
MVRNARKDEMHRREEAFFLACENNRIATVENAFNKTWFQKMCFQKSIDPNYVYRAQTPLCISAENGHEQVVSTLLDNGAAIDFRNTFGHSALVEAVCHNQRGTIRLLLKRGANVNTACNSGRTILQHAAAASDLETVKFLLQYPNIKEQINLQDREGSTPLDVIFSRTDLSETERKNFIGVVANTIQDVSNNMMVVLRSLPALGRTNGHFVFNQVLEHLLFRYSSTKDGCEVLKQVIRKSVNSIKIYEVSNKNILHLYNKVEKCSLTIPTSINTSQEQNLPRHALKRIVVCAV